MGESFVENLVRNEQNIFRLNKDTTPTCGVDDFVKTWDEYYEAANLRETYKFLSSPSFNLYSRSSNNSHIRRVRSPDWTPLQQSFRQEFLDYHPEDRSYQEIDTKDKEIINHLNVDTLPPVMEFRVCEFTSKLKSSLSCVFDSSLAASRELDECINNIMDVSAIRLDVTQKVIDILRELEDLETKEENHYG